MADDVKTFQTVQAVPPQGPSIYCNGFELALSAGDIAITIAQNNRKVAVLNLSFTTAKTLASNLTTAIKHLEEKSGREIMDYEAVAKSLNLNQLKDQ